MAEAQNPLDQLKDIHLPPEASVWPLAPGWWVVVLLCMVLVGLAFIFFLKRRRIQRFRRSVVGMLHDIRLPENESDTPRFLGEVSVLLRRVAIHCYPRMDVASLSGERWLLFLDEKGDTDRFMHGVGQALAEGPYRIHTAAEAERLRQLAESWIQRNLESEA